MFDKFLDVIYIPPEPQTVAQITDPIVSTGPTVIQFAVSVIASIFFAFALISAAIYISKHSKKANEGA